MPSDPWYHSNLQDAESELKLFGMSKEIDFVPEKSNKYLANFLPIPITTKIK